jgi:hypothetical protein
MWCHNLNAQDIGEGDTVEQDYYESEFKYEGNGANKRSSA